MVGQLQEPNEESQWELWEPSVVLPCLLVEPVVGEQRLLPPQVLISRSSISLFIGCMGWEMCSL